MQSTLSSPTSSSSRKSSGLPAAPIRGATRRVIMMWIELYPESKKGLADLCDKLGMTQIAATSRVIEWFTSQSEVVQAAILGLYPHDIRAEVVEMILKRIGANGKGK